MTVRVGTYVNCLALCADIARDHIIRPNRPVRERMQRSFCVSLAPDGWGVALSPPVPVSEMYLHRAHAMAQVHVVTHAVLVVGDPNLPAVGSVSAW